MIKLPTLGTFVRPERNAERNTKRSSDRCAERHAERRALGGPERRAFASTISGAVLRADHCAGPCSNSGTGATVIRRYKLLNSPP